MLSWRVAIVLYVLFSLGIQRPGKHLLIETKESTEDCMEYGMDFCCWNSNPVLPISVSDEASAAPLQSRNKAWGYRADTEEACRANNDPGELLACCWRKGDSPHTKIVETYFCDCSMYGFTECPKNQQTTYQPMIYKWRRLPDWQAY